MRSLVLECSLVLAHSLLSRMQMLLLRDPRFMTSLLT